MPRPPTDTKSFSALMQIVADLRGPEGCPWDRLQTHQSLAPFAIEEAHELAEVLDQVREIDSQESLDFKLLDFKLKDELGDLLFQVALHAQIAQERNAFTIDDVFQNLNEKMIRRHPHVFGDVRVQNVEQVWTQWEKIKAAEKAGREHSAHSQGAKSQTVKKATFDFPQTLPALQRAYKIGVKSQKLKFDWPHLSEVQLKLTEELAELQEAIESKNKESIQEELGDVLFTLAQVARHLEFEPEQALRKANLKFETRFESVLKLASEKELIWTELSDATKETLWSEVKRMETKKMETAKPNKT